MKTVFLTGALALAFLVLGEGSAHAFAPPRPVYPPASPNCQVKSIQQLPSDFDALALAPGSDTAYFNAPDLTGKYQLYSQKTGEPRRCMTCIQVSGGPRVDRHKMMTAQHPSGKWIFVGIEEDYHDLMWLPESWQIGLLQSGIWLNMWVTNPAGDRWWRLTDFSASAQANGYVGTPFTSDGQVGVWAEAQNGADMSKNTFGVWRLYAAEFVVDAAGNPGFVNKRDITPSDARWVEPGNFHPDKRRILLSTDIGMGDPRDASGQDQWALDIYTGQLTQLMNTPKVWDEHGLYSPDGKRVVYMSNYHYSLAEPESYRVWSLKTEFMLVNSDGSGLQLLTHFNEPGYPESQTVGTIAAVAQWGEAGTLQTTVMGPNFSKTNWLIRFQGPCGSEF
jgi:hypothetical protein